MIKKILIANRGEISLRIIKACKELGIKTVAVYSEADKESLSVQFADEAYQIGEAPAYLSYLKSEAIVTVAKLTGCDAIHPGYGFLSESSEFCQLCESEGIIFIGPTSKNLEQLGDKFQAKLIAKQVGIPVVKGNITPLNNATDLEKILKTLNFPVLLKASYGGGGKGIKKCSSIDEALGCYSELKEESQKTFGNSEIYVEECLESFRHIEIQITGDKHRNFLHLGERNCSIQRNRQKIIEETPSPSLPAHTRLDMCELAVKLAKELNYQGVGTVEFIYDYQKDEFYFMEMNTRIQVEHPITEMVTGLDLIKEQIKIASGLATKTSQQEVSTQGFSLECRINAEDPKHSFFPSTGTIDFLVLPTNMPGVRVDTLIYTGYQVPVFYDAMLCKVITYGRSRSEAVTKMKVALETTIISGVATNLEFLQDILNDEVFKSGDYDNHFIRDVK